MPQKKNNELCLYHLSSQEALRWFPWTSDSVPELWIFDPEGYFPSTFSLSFFLFSEVFQKRSLETNCSLRNSSFLHRSLHGITDFLGILSRRFKVSNSCGSHTILASDESGESTGLKSRQHQKDAVFFALVHRVCCWVCCLLTILHQRAGREGNVNVNYLIFLLGGWSSKCL